MNINTSHNKVDKSSKLGEFVLNSWMWRLISPTAPFRALRTPTGSNNAGAERGREERRGKRDRGKRDRGVKDRGVKDRGVRRGGSVKC